MVYFRFGGELLLLSLLVDDVDDDDADDDDDEAGGNAGADAVKPVSLPVPSVPAPAAPSVPVLATAVLLLSESCSLCSA